MAENIDSLQIEINAQATKANQAIDRLVGKIDKLTTSMSRLDGSNLASFANGVQKLGTAMQTMNNVKTADFSRLARNLQNLNNIDASKLSNISANIKHIATAFNGLSGMDKSAEQISLLANGIKQLGYSSAEKAITNIPQLATAMKKLMEELSTAPKVSQNLIDMTNALAKLARTGSSSGKAANSLINSFNGISKASKGVKFNIFGATSGIKSLGRQLLSVTGIAGGFYAVFNGIKKSMDISSDLTEVQNVVDVTFGDFKKKIEGLSNVSIPELGMSELTAKQVGSRFQAMGTAIGIAQGKMADMSVNLTRLTGDMASFYNVSQQDMGKSLQAIFTGETEPLRRYGIDLTQATLQEWALKNGIDANINSMSQMEKTMLRYQYVISNTKAAQGDFIRTQDTWANQVRVLQQNFQALGSIIGGMVINSLKPLVKWINIIIAQTTEFAKVVSDALGTIFGWTYEEGGGATNPIEDMANGMEDVSNATDDAANAQKKYNKQLAGFDELNNYTTSEKANISSALGGGTLDDQGSASYGTWKQGESIIKGFESDIDTLYKLGDTIGDTLKKAMDNIDWDSVYKKAEGFGSGLASFLNGLFSKDKNGETVLGSLGKTIAGTLNTVIYSVFSFSNKFDWFDFGSALEEGIQNFLNTADLAKAGYSVGNLVKGISTSVYAVVSDKKTWENMGKKIGNGINSFFKSMGNVNKKTGLTGWETLGKNISSTISGVEISITNALKSVDWENVGQSIGDFLSNIEWGNVIWNFAKMAIEVIKAIGKAINTSLKVSPIETGIAVAVGAIKAKNILSNIAFANGISNVASKIISTIGEKMMGKTVPIESIGIAVGKTFKVIGIAAVATAIAAKITRELTAQNVDITLVELNANTEEIEKIKTQAEKSASDLSVEIGQIDMDYEERIKKIRSLSDLFFELSKKEKLSSEEADVLKRTYKKLVKEMPEIRDNVDKQTKAYKGTKNELEKLIEKTEKYYLAQAAEEKLVKIAKEKLNVQMKLSEAQDIYNKTISKRTVLEEKIKDIQKKIYYYTNVNYDEERVRKLTLEQEKYSRELETTVEAEKRQKTQIDALEQTSKKLSENYKSVTTELDTMSGKDVSINVDTTGNAKEDVENLQKRIDKLKEKQYKIKMSGDSKDAKEKIENLQNKIDKLENKKHKISIEANVTWQEKYGGKTFKSSIPQEIQDWIVDMKYNQKAMGGIFNGKKWSKIQQYAVGGFPNHGQMFIARESGPELVGTLGGNTAVINNDQIVASVSDGVANAVAKTLLPMLSSISQGGDIVVQIDGQNIATAVRKQNSVFKKRTGKSMFD